jgi:predicted nucleotidyltransferase
MERVDYRQLMNIAAHIRKRNEDERERIRERVIECRKYLTTIVQEFLRIDHKIRKIVLFGSLAEQSVSHENFDIDIAVDSNRYLKIVAWSLDQPVKIDVIDLETAPEHILSRIHEHGEVIYEAAK